MDKYCDGHEHHFSNSIVRSLLPSKHNKVFKEKSSFMTKRTNNVFKISLLALCLIH